MKTKSKKSNHFYEVEKIVRKRISSTGIPEYEIKWLGWDAIYNTWEPIENLKQIKEMVIEYEKNNPDKGQIDINQIFSEDEEEDSMSIVSVPYGDIDIDTPLRIIRMFKDAEGTIKAEIEWTVRKTNGFKPTNTYIDASELKIKYIDLLIEYYESRIRFVL